MNAAPAVAASSRSNVTRKLRPGDVMGASVGGVVCLHTKRHILWIRAAEATRASIAANRAAMWSFAWNATVDDAASIAATLSCVTAQRAGTGTLSS